MTEAQVPEGRLIIVWPEGVQGVNLYDMSLYDADTGSAILTATSMTLTTGPDGMMSARLTMLCDPDGTPLRSGEPVIPGPDGKVVLGDFTWVIAGVRTRSSFKKG